MFWLFGFLLFNNIFSHLCICQSELESIKKISQPLVLKFNTTNNILLKGEINEESSSKFIYDFLTIKINKSNIVCDVSNKIVDKITKKNIYYLLENCPAIKPVS